MFFLVKMQPYLWKSALATFENLQKQLRHKMEGNKKLKAKIQRNQVDI